jgi:hypothetical protein
MSGERQHFLPRFLLRGFDSRTNLKGTYTWVFRRERDPFESNIINVGVSKEFYTVGDDTTLDDLITQMEDSFGFCVSSLRSQTQDQAIQSADVPDLITHLIMRTKHLRDLILEPANYFVEALLSELERPEIFEKMALNEIRSDKFAKNLFKGQHLSKRERARRVEAMLKIAPAFVAQQYPNFMLLVSGMKRQFRQKLPQMLKDGHIKVLARNPLPQARLEFARTLKWFLLVRENAHFILGDVGVVTKVGPNGKLKSLPDVDDDIIRVLLPISDRHLIVGVKDSAVLNQSLDAINLETTALSRDFFVSRTNTDRERNYALTLGSQSRLFTDDELARIVSDVLAESK